MLSSRYSRAIPILVGIGFIKWFAAAEQMGHFHSHSSESHYSAACVEPKLPSILHNVSSFHRSRSLLMRIEESHAQAENGEIDKSISKFLILCMVWLWKSWSCFLVRHNGSFDLTRNGGSYAGSIPNKPQFYRQTHLARVIYSVMILSVVLFRYH